MNKYEIYLAVFYAVCICLLLLTQYYISVVDKRIKEVGEFNKEMWTLS